MNKAEIVKNGYKVDFDSYESSLNGEKSSVLHRFRKKAMAAVEKLQFPTQRQEEWKYTNTSILAEKKFHFVECQSGLVSKKELAPHTFGGDFINLVFINGYFESSLSSQLDEEEGLTLSTLSEAIKSHPEDVEKYLGKIAASDSVIFTALNEAFLKDGVFLKTSQNKTIEKPVHVIWLSKCDDFTIAQPRILAVAAENSSLTIIESFISLNDSSYFNNVVSEFELGENSVVKHIKIQNENPAAYHISRREINQNRGSSFTSYNLCFGAKLNRNDINSKFSGQGANSNFYGLYLASGEQLVDNHTLIDHAQPHCDSRELYKGVMSGSSRAIFNGKVIVRKDAQKTNAFQQNNNILLSQDAQVDTKPQLEIFADDVKCSHGATIGQLNKNSLFYLRSRGLSFETARAILIHAFASDVISDIQFDSVKLYLENLIHAKLNS